MALIVNCFKDILCWLAIQPNLAESLFTLSYVIKVKLLSVSHLYFLCTPFILTLSVQFLYILVAVKIPCSFLFSDK